MYEKVPKIAANKNDHDTHAKNEKPLTRQKGISDENCRRKWMRTAGETDTR